MKESLFLLWELVLEFYKTGSAKGAQLWMTFLFICLLPYHAPSPWGLMAFILFFFNQDYVQPKLKYFALFELDANQN